MKFLAAAFVAGAAAAPLYSAGSTNPYYTLVVASSQSPAIQGPLSFNDGKLGFWPGAKGAKFFSTDYTPTSTLAFHYGEMANQLVLVGSGGILDIDSITNPSMDKIPAGNIAEWSTFKIGAERNIGISDGNDIPSRRWVAYPAQDGGFTVALYDGYTKTDKNLTTVTITALPVLPDPVIPTPPAPVPAPVVLPPVIAPPAPSPIAPPKGWPPVVGSDPTTIVGAPSLEQPGAWQPAPYPGLPTSPDSSPIVAPPSLQQPTGSPQNPYPGWSIDSNGVFGNPNPQPVVVPALTPTTVISQPSVIASPSSLLGSSSLTSALGSGITWLNNPLKGLTDLLGGLFSPISSSSSSSSSSKPKPSPTSEAAPKPTKKPKDHDDDDDGGLFSWSWGDDEKKI